MGVKVPWGSEGLRWGSFRSQRMGGSAGVGEFRSWERHKVTEDEEKVVVVWEEEHHHSPEKVLPPGRGTTPGARKTGKTAGVVFAPWCRPTSRCMQREIEEARPRGLAIRFCDTVQDVNGTSAREVLKPSGLFEPPPPPAVTISKCRVEHESAGKLRQECPNVTRNRGRDDREACCSQTERELLPASIEVCETPAPSRGCLAQHPPLFSDNHIVSCFIVLFASFIAACHSLRTVCGVGGVASLIAFFGFH